MKKISAFLVVCFWSLSAYAAAAEIVVTGIEGEAVLTADGSDVKAVKGMAIPEGGVLKSGDQGTVDVSIYGNSGFRFLADTKVVFASTNPQEINLRLEAGNLIARFKNKIDPDASFEVETPTAVLAVRGTQFWGRVVSPGENPATSFAVREGAVSVTAKSSGQTFMLNAGQAIELLDDAEPVLREAAVAELEAIAGSETIEI